MNYFKQIYYEMKHQRMMTWVSIGGTALAIFLVMAFIMANQIPTVEVTPESNRSRIMQGKNIHIQMNGGGDISQTGINYDFAGTLYENLDGVEMVCYMQAWDDNCDVNVKGGEIFTMLPKTADGNFWNIYDFTFIDGHPFDQAEAESNAQVVVLSRSAARALFGEEKVSGREIEIDTYTYRIVGVVEDVNPLLTATYANFYKPYSKRNDNDDPYMGSTCVTLLLKPGVSPGHIKEQVEQNYNKMKSEFSKENKTLVYHEQPYTSEEMSQFFGSNNSPSSSHITDWIIYSVLILLPAINLSSMTRGRLRHRVSEIGVRRAFGARRISIVGQLFGENLIVTMIGGIIGLVVSLLFMMFIFHLFFNFSGVFGPSSLEVADARPDINMLFTWKNFFVAFIICFILNTLCATVPAWKSSRVEPAEALAAAR